MNNFIDNSTVIIGFLISFSLFTFTYFSISSEEELFAQQQGTISVDQATALPLINAEGYQVKVVINYSMGSESFLGQKMNAIMGIYDRINGTLIKLTSFPNGFILNNTDGTIQLASTLTDPKIQNISTIATLTNAEKSEKYSNDARSDLNLRSILPTSLPVPALNETLASPSPSPSLPPPPPPFSSGSAGANLEAPSDDDSNSDED
ncbi:MAG: hypothetical protein ACRD8Z_17820 [Nitrososphaeraceae archaeon]